MALEMLPCAFAIATLLLWMVCTTTKQPEKKISFWFSLLKQPNLFKGKLKERYTSSQSNKTPKKESLYKIFVSSHRVTDQLIDCFPPPFVSP